MALPKAIDPCPIADALVEIRFTTKFPPNAVFGLIYNSLQKDFSKTENLPILQLPEAVRASDPSFRFKPHYRISNDKFVVQVGPDVLTIGSFPNYVGWDEFSNKIFEILGKIENTNIVQSITRVGIRYINFFDSNIFKDLSLKICIKDDDIEYNNTIVRTEISQGDFTSTLQVANNANNNGKKGSIVDIDTSTEVKLDNFFKNKESILSDGHNKEKELFFSLLTPEFLNKFNPTYE